MGRQLTLLDHSRRSFLFLAFGLTLPTLGRSSRRSLEGLLKVGNDIVNVLSANRYTDKVLSSVSITHST